MDGNFLNYYKNIKKINNIIKNICFEALIILNAYFLNIQIRNRKKKIKKKKKKQIKK